MMKIKLFDIKLNSLTKSEFIHELERCNLKKTPSLITTVNVEFINTAIINNDFFEVLNKHASLNIIDGGGVIWAYKTLSSWKPRNKYISYFYVPIHWLVSLVVFPISFQYFKKSLSKLSGSDIVWDICRYAALNKKRVFLLGYKKGLDPNVVQKTSLKLQTDIPDLKIVGTLSATDSPAEEKKVTEIIKKSSSDILLCGFGSPGQELWLKRNLLKSGCKIGIGLGGTFDFVAGVQKRAPVWIQKIGFEWFYRLLKNPRRIKRQSALIKVAFLVLKNRFIATKYAPTIDK